jgi:hypothetical protein
MRMAHLMMDYVKLFQFTFWLTSTHFQLISVHFSSRKLISFSAIKTTMIKGDKKDMCTDLHYSFVCWWRNTL